MAKGKIKDLDAYLTKTSGFDADAREQWRNDIAKLQKLGHKQEAIDCFMSMSYWKNNIQGKL